MAIWPPRLPRILQPVWRVVKTLAGILLLWALFVIVMPIGVSILEVESGIQRFPGLTVPATMVMPIFMLLGLWAAWTLAWTRRTAREDGTGKRLVVTGPYAFVRNPLVISALGQGTAIALAFGSLLVSLYVVIGAVVWHAFLRPRAERRLRRRYGAAWERYAREVRAIRPRMRPSRNDERRTTN